jgi:hypothetical protein
VNVVQFSSVLILILLIIASKYFQTVVTGVVETEGIEWERQIVDDIFKVLLPKMTKTSKKTVTQAEKLKRAFQHWVSVTLALFK